MCGGGTGTKFTDLEQQIARIHHEGRRARVAESFHGVAQRFGDRFESSLTRMHSEYCQDNGTLSYKYFSKLSLELLGPIYQTVFRCSLTLQQLQLYFKQFDQDGNLEMDLGEFTEFMTWASKQIMQKVIDQQKRPCEHVNETLGRCSNDTLDKFCPQHGCGSCGRRKRRDQDRCDACAAGSGPNQGTG